MNLVALAYEQQERSKENDIVEKFSNWWKINGNSTLNKSTCWELWKSALHSVGVIDKITKNNLDLPSD